MIWNTSINLSGFHCGLLVTLKVFILWRIVDIWLAARLLYWANTVLCYRTNKSLVVGCRHNKLRWCADNGEEERGARCRFLQIKISVTYPAQSSFLMLRKKEWEGRNCSQSWRWFIGCAIYTLHYGVLALIGKKLDADSST